MVTVGVPQVGCTVTEPAGVEGAEGVALIITEPPVTIQLLFAVLLT